MFTHKQKHKICFVKVSVHYSCMQVGPQMRFSDLLIHALQLHLGTKFEKGAVPSTNKPLIKSNNKIYWISPSVLFCFCTICQASL